MLISGGDSRTIYKLRGPNILEPLSLSAKSIATKVQGATWCLALAPTIHLAPRCHSLQAPVDVAGPQKVANPVTYLDLAATHKIF